MHQGSCLCGAIRFEVTGDLHTPDACHCQQCRKQSGHFWASTDIQSAALTIHDHDDQLTWYQASAKVRRGFCKRCGSFLFWDPLVNDSIAVAMGAFDTPTQLTLGKHIFVAEQGDYYEIGDGLPQHQR